VTWPPFDFAQRQLRGNLPQAFVHALFLESSIRLARPAPDPSAPI
jgi:alpha,alpha-trehalase